MAVVTFAVVIAGETALVGYPSSLSSWLLGFCFLSKGGVTPGTIEREQILGLRKLMPDTFLVASVECGAKSTIYGLNFALTQWRTNGKIQHSPSRWKCTLEDDL